MFAMMLATYWRRSWMLVAACALATLAVPLLMVNPLAHVPGAAEIRMDVFEWLQAAEAIGRALPVGTLALGVLAGLTAWTDDQRGGHVYALSLPVRRVDYVLMRFGVAVVVVLVPCLTLLAGSLIASAMAPLPAGIHAYPVALSVRFALASLTCMAVFFALAGATRRAAVIMFLVLAALLIAELVVRIAGFDSLMERLVQWALWWPSPFELLTGRWALFDV